MAISRDLFLSILALDSYNRGYGAGTVINVGNAPIRLGNAEFIDSRGTAAAADRGFYGIAYSWNGEKVISYRGTDNFGLSSNPVAGASDILNGWVAGIGYTPDTQLGLAAEFYKSVTGSTSVYARDASVVLTGHSLGGGLAGYVAALSGSKGVGFDHMPFGVAAYIQYAYDLANGVAGIQPPDWAQFKGYFVQGITELR
ncbi:MAG: hypothetical protein ACKVON_00745 [Beijerinckiaceae bacterium]